MEAVVHASRPLAGGWGVYRIDWAGDSGTKGTFVAAFAKEQDADAIAMDLNAVNLPPVVPADVEAKRNRRREYAKLWRQQHGR